MSPNLTQKSLNVATLQEDESVQLTCQRLGYGDAVRRDQLLVALDDFLRDYVTTDQVNGVEVGCAMCDDKALDEITTGWLDDEGNGRLFWPRLLPEQRPKQPQYDDFDHTMIVREIEILICTINRARQNVSTAATMCVHKPMNPNLSSSPRKYTAIARATLLSYRRDTKLIIHTTSNDAELYRTLSSLVDCEGNISTLSSDPFDELSCKLQAELSKDHVVTLPSIFFPLHRFVSESEQERIAKPSLDYLHDNGIIAKVGTTVERRLQEAAKACGKLCFELAHDLPPELSDEELPDLLAKLTMSKFGLIAPQIKSGPR